ncbi:MAG: 2Fe-2S iron-sulfur cluster-binding protein [Methylobacter sp.]
MIIKTTELKTFDSATDVSILDAALKSSLVFEYSCKNGRCGVCKTTLLEGEVKELQPQQALSEQDRTNHKILSCCCTPVTDILIDAEDLTALKDIEIKTLPARISQVNWCADSIIEVVLRFPPTTNLKFLEGQYIDVIWGDTRRSYSIASTRDDKEITLLIKKVDQGVMSDYWFNQAKVDDLLRIEGPKGTFFLRDINMPLVMLATGTGIAPIMSILKKLDLTPDFNQQQPIYLFWGNRYAEEFIWQPEFKNINVIMERIVSKPDLNWIGKTGYIQNVAIELLGATIAQCNVYACGSNAMIQSAKQAFEQAGLIEKQFYSDAFVQSY